MVKTVPGRVAGGVLAWLLALGVGAAVAHPESCPPASRPAARSAVTDAVAWLHRNQAADGRFLYRYDRDAQRVLPGYVEARHAGTLLALEQAAAAGIPDAAPTAERGLAWARARLTELPGGRRAFTGETGATALLVTALVERRRSSGDAGDDDLLVGLGTFLLGTVVGDGAVVAGWDLARDRPVTGSRSPFFTGEVLFALARLHAEFPHAGWDGAARKVARYLSTRRDDAERRFPPVSDHWASYAFAEMARWPGGALRALTDDDIAYAERLAGLFGLQTRYESQRRPGGIARLSRGPVAVPAGLATLGEGLGHIRLLAASDDRLTVDGRAVAERLACVAGMLIRRQAHHPDQRVDGAWFRLGVTQVDDAQHAISALLAALPMLDRAA